jgi:hypothetical protein
LNAHSVASKQHNAARIKNYLALRFACMGKILCLPRKQTRRSDSELLGFVASGRNSLSDWEIKAIPSLYPGLSGILKLHRVAVI